MLLSIPYIAALLLIILKSTDADDLGQTFNNDGIMQCWQNNKLMVGCPEDLSLHWDLLMNDTIHSGMPFSVKINMTLHSELQSKLILPANIDMHLRACKYSIGKLCTPFIAIDNHSVVELDHIVSDSAGVFDLSMVLESAEWNIIAHGVIYLNDSTYYGLASDLAISTDYFCSANRSENISVPWKLDFAIGMAHHVDDHHTDHIMNVQVEGWVLFIVIIIILSFAFAAFRTIKHFNSEYRIKSQNDDTKLQAAQALKRQLLIELVTVIISFTISTFDWTSDTWALYEVQHQDHASPYIVYSYFGVVCVVTIFYFYTVYMTLKDIFAIASEYRYGIPNFVEKLDDSPTQRSIFTPSRTTQEQNIQPVTPTQSKAQDEALGGSFTPSKSSRRLQTPIRIKKQRSKIIRHGNINFELSRITRGIREEKINIIMCITEDIPMFLFNGILMFWCHIDTIGVMISFIINCLMLGYKIAGIERLWYLTQLKHKCNSMLTAAKLSRNVTVNQSRNAENSELIKSARKIGRVLIHNDSKYAFNSDESSTAE
eukprot:102248_1